MRSVVAIVAVLVMSACSSPAVVGVARKPKPTVPAPDTPTIASDRPFAWVIEVYEDQGVTAYSPADTRQRIPMPGSEWVCAHGGRQASRTAEGTYVEVRDIVCGLPTGPRVGGRTLCTREPSGKVVEDTQVIGISDGKADLRVLVKCTEGKPPIQEKPLTAPAAKQKPESTPMFEQPTSLTL